MWAHKYDRDLFKLCITDSNNIHTAKKWDNCTSTVQQRELPDAVHQISEHCLPKNPDHLFNMQQFSFSFINNLRTPEFEKICFKFILDVNKLTLH